MLAGHFSRLSGDTALELLIELTAIVHPQIITDVSNDLLEVSTIQEYQCALVALNPDRERSLTATTWCQKCQLSEMLPSLQIANVHLLLCCVNCTHVSRVNRLVLEAFDNTIYYHVEVVTWVSLSEHIVALVQSFYREHIEKLDPLILVHAGKEVNGVYERGVNVAALASLLYDDTLEDLSVNDLTNTILHSLNSCSSLTVVQESDLTEPNSCTDILLECDFLIEFRILGIGPLLVYSDFNAALVQNEVFMANVTKLNDNLTVLIDSFGHGASKCLQIVLIEVLSKERLLEDSSDPLELVGGFLILGRDEVIFYLLLALIGL